jgi:hypothetical protein
MPQRLDIQGKILYSENQLQLFYTAFFNSSSKMNYPVAEQRGICKGNETPQAAGN